MFSIKTILLFNLGMVIISFLLYLFMVYFFQLLKLNSWDNYVLFIGYVPLRGVGYVIMPNFPVFIFIITIAVNAYFFRRLSKGGETTNNLW